MDRHCIQFRPRIVVGTTASCPWTPFIIILCKNGRLIQIPPNAFEPNRSGRRLIATCSIWYRHHPNVECFLESNRGTTDWRASHVDDDDWQDVPFAKIREHNRPATNPTAFVGRLRPIEAENTIRVVGVNQYPCWQQHQHHHQQQQDT